MARKRDKLQGLDLAAKVLPPGENGDLSNWSLMDMVGGLNAVSKRLEQVKRESGNGLRFRETRNILMNNLAHGKKP